MRRRNSDPYALANTQELKEYWTKQIRELGRNLFFVETGFVIASFDPSKRGTAETVLREFATGRLVTSTYVITEVVRRIVKSKAWDFLGPNGEQKVELALYFVFAWLSEKKVVVLCPPECVYHEATRIFRECRIIGCDLTDVLSFVLVRGLEQDAILSQDSHFRALGLRTLYNE